MGAPPGVPGHPRGLLRWGSTFDRVSQMNAGAGGRVGGAQETARGLALGLAVGDGGDVSG